MSRESLAYGFSALGAAMNICLFISQTPIILAVIKEKNSDRYSYVPSLTLMIVMTIWCAYTIFVIPTPQLYAGNFPGMIIPLLNLLVFCIYSTQWKRKMTIFLLTLVALTGAWGIPIGLFSIGPAGYTAVNVIIIVLSIGFWISPLPILYTAFKEHDISRVPITLSCAQGLQSVTWIIAGINLQDSIITGVNGGALFFALLQISLYIYIRIQVRSKEATTTTTSTPGSSLNTQEKLTAPLASLSDSTPTSTVELASSSVNVTIQNT